ncbi:hypothetical protein CP985_07650 [Malaciobacter mytili LMG 24559]|uniref:DUF2931 domain-containing protein n=1 Tax=Malaciobacter mytili LMG 24559 TaxID=1032238 RepID=A0AAX2AGA4_9BACT|nr:hypothetical protein [Malaciobacter mytili]AXH15116.1 hypothetical protein AMYT_1541 [Malaciobacter mytili LMG 24559]RXK15625.1 hypothetical protein CP985_07650 [Malaciobacter mytili LMG 24559]
MEFLFITIAFILYIANTYFCIYTRMKLSKILNNVFDKRLKIDSFELKYSPFPLFLIPTGSKTVVLLDIEDNEYFSLYIHKDDTWEIVVKKIAQKREDKNLFIKNSKQLYKKLKDKIEDEFFIRFYLPDIVGKNYEIKYEVIVYINEENELKNGQICKNYEFIKEFVKSNEDVVFKIYAKNKNNSYKKQIKKGYFGISEKIGGLILHNESIWNYDYLYKIKNNKYYYFNKIFDKSKELSYYQNLRRIIYNESFEKNYFLNNEKIYLEVGRGLEELIKDKFQVTLFNDRAFNIETFLSKEDESLLLECYVPLEDSKIKKIIFNLKETTFEVQQLDFN